MTELGRPCQTQKSIMGADLAQSCHSAERVENASCAKAGHFRSSRQAKGTAPKILFIDEPDPEARSDNLYKPGQGRHLFDTEVGLRTGFHFLLVGNQNLPEKLMAKRPVTEYSIPELEKALRSAQVVQRTTAVVFALIILAWIVGGYVAQNTLVFITTVVMAVAIAAVQQASKTALRKELARRK